LVEFCYDDEGVNVEPQEDSFVMVVLFVLDTVINATLFIPVHKTSKPAATGWCG